MIDFAYRAIHKSGRLQKGRMTAANENELAFLLSEMDLELIEAKDKSARQLRLNAISSSPPIKECVALCLQLADLLGAGLTLDDALTTIADSTPQPAMRSLLLNVIKSARAGGRLTRAFSDNGALFDPVALALLHTGEASGHLVETFSTIAAHLAEQEKMRRELRQALRYPLFLLVIACCVITFMMTLVVPQIVTFLTSLDQQLPPSTRFLIFCADGFSALWWLFPILGMGSWGGLSLARRLSPIALIKTDKSLLNLPLIGAILHKRALARMLTSLDLLMTSGLTLSQALDKACATFGNAALNDMAHAARQRLDEGAPFSSAFSMLLPPHTRQMLKVGEASGHLTNALQICAQSLEREARDTSAAFLGFLEPALTLLVGSILAWIVLAVLGPVYASLGPLSQGI